MMLIFIGFILLIVQTITALPEGRFVGGSSLGISLEKELADCMADEFNKSMFSTEIMQEMCMEIYNYIADQLVLDLGKEWADINISHSY